MDPAPPRMSLSVPLSVPLSPPLSPAATAAPRDAGKPALVHKAIALTYDRVVEDADRIAGKLVELGIAPGDFVGVHVRQPVTHWMVTLGLMRIGAVSLSLTDNAPNELAALPRMSAVICGAGEEGAFPETLWRFAVTRDWLERPRPAADALVSPQAAARTVGRICFTSGTSGRPKAILLDAGLLGARLAGTAPRHGIDGASVLWCGLGPDTAFGFTATLATWLEGGTVFLAGGGGGAFAQMHARGVNRLIASPAAVAPLIRDAHASGLAPLDAPAIVAGGRLSVELRDRIRAHVCTQVMVAYGSSEAGGVTVGDAAALDTHPGGVGTVFADVEVEVTDARGTPLPPGTEGQLRVRTVSTVPGYLNDDAASAAFSAACFDGGWFRPGDTAALSGSGALTLLGRTAQVLNLGGVKVPAEDLEARLCALDDVDDACAFQVTRGGADPELVVVVVARPGAAEALGPAIRSALPRLPAFRVFRAETLPRGAMGKIRKHKVAGAVAAALEGTGGELALEPLATG